MGENIFNIPTYIICNNNTNNNISIKHEFSEREEFELHVINIGIKDIASNIWIELRKIIKQKKAEANDDVIIICTDWHRFSENYNYNTLINNIINGAELGAQIIFGGCENVLDIIHVKDNLFWTNKIKESAFIIIFRSAFDTIIRSRRHKNETFTNILSRNIPNKFIIFPFISKIITKEKQINNNINEKQTNKTSEEKFKTYTRIMKKYNLK